MARLTMPPPDELTADQKMVCDEVVAGIRGKVPAPMIAWLRNPELARRAQHLGELIRYQTTLEPLLSELAILVCGRHWSSHMEWTAHKREGLKAGLDPQIIADIAARRKPVFPDFRQSAVYELSVAVLTTGRVNRALYAQAVAILGEQGLVELVAILGYYSFAGLTLNVFELGLPENVAPELEDSDFAGTR
jgi:4-carboxymuconolactone decarboxylase